MCSVFFFITEVICVQKRHLFISFLQRKLLVLKVKNRLLLLLAVRIRSGIVVCVFLGVFSSALQSQSQISSNENHPDQGNKIPIVRMHLQSSRYLYVQDELARGSRDCTYS